MWVHFQFLRRLSSDTHQGLCEDLIITLWATLISWNSTYPLYFAFKMVLLEFSHFLRYFLYLLMELLKFVNLAVVVHILIL